MRYLKGLSCIFLLTSSLSIFPVQGSDFSLFTTDFEGQKKMTVSYTFLGDSTANIRNILGQPGVKNLCTLFQPTLQIEDKGNQISIKATQGAHDVARHLFGKDSVFDNPMLTQLLGTKGQRALPLDQLIPRGFDTQVYMLLNSDLGTYLPEAQDRNFAALSHYVNFGRLEGRRFVPKEFNAESYLACNPDVQGVAMQQKDPLAFAALHRYVWAPQENRPYLPADFDEAVYLKLHPDVNTQAQETANPLEVARQHYLRDGRNENRSYKITLPEDFDYVAYVTINKDVLIESTKTISIQKYAMWHYTHHGFFEGRTYKKEG